MAMAQGDEYETELRMNLVAIKRVDPYAKDIVDSSAHVAFYTFNARENEWEKTDIEGAFFIYSRNAEPFYSIFINNRLNTKPLVEPITALIQLQSQPPFLLYRNERSRIRGFWFSNILECDRHCQLIGRLINECDMKTTGGSNSAAAVTNSQPNIPHCNVKNIGDKTTIFNENKPNESQATTAIGAQPVQGESPNNVNIFSMLSKAQEDFDNISTVPPSITNTDIAQTIGVINNKMENMIIQPPQLAADGTPESVMNFFAAAKQPSASEVPMFQRILSNPLHTVEHIEKQQRIVTPLPQNPESKNSPVTVVQNQPMQSVNDIMQPQPQIATPHQQILCTSPYSPFYTVMPMTTTIQMPTPISTNLQLDQHPQFHQQQIQIIAKSEGNDIGVNNNNTVLHSKPALMPPTMFLSSLISYPGANHIVNHNGIVPLENQPGQNRTLTFSPVIVTHNTNHIVTPVTAVETGTSFVPAPHNKITNSAPEPLTQNQLIQAVNYLIRNDAEFVRKLHEAYLKSFTEMVQL